ncbi:MAG: thioredoxin family protein [bacterium]
MLRSLFHSALPFTAFLEQVKTNVALWQDTYRLAHVPSDAVARFAALPGRWHLLVVVEDWCGDAVNTVPLIARVAELAPNVDLRVIGRDEQTELMETHLTCGSRSIPVVIVLDEDFEERAWWGPRPRALQESAMGEWSALPKDARYRLIRTWYARDRGRATVDEIIAVIEDAAPSAGVTEAGRGADPRGRHDWNCDEWSTAVASR